MLKELGAAAFSQSIGEGKSKLTLQLKPRRLRRRCCRAWTRTKNTHIQSVVCYQLHHAANVEILTALRFRGKEGESGKLLCPETPGGVEKEHGKSPAGIDFGNFLD